MDNGSKRIQSVFLNKAGVMALSHLSNTYLRDNNILDCHEVDAGHHYYLKVKAQLQRNLPPDVLIDTLASLLIPHQFVDLVVLEIEDTPVGFVQE